MNWKTKQRAAASSSCMKHESSFHACHQKHPATAAAWRDAGGRLINRPLLQMMNTHARTRSKQKRKKNILANNCGSIEVKKKIIQNAEVKNGGAAHRVACWHLSSWEKRELIVSRQASVCIHCVCIIGFWNTGRPGASFVKQRFQDSLMNLKLLCTVTTQHFWERLWTCCNTAKSQTLGGGWMNSKMAF